MEPSLVGTEYKLRHGTVPPTPSTVFSLEIVRTSDPHRIILREESDNTPILVYTSPLKNTGDKGMVGFMFEVLSDVDTALHVFGFQISSLEIRQGILVLIALSMLANGIFHKMVRREFSLTELHGPQDRKIPQDAEAFENALIEEALSFSNVLIRICPCQMTATSLTHAPQP